MEMSPHKSDPSIKYMIMYHKIIVLKYCFFQTLEKVKQIPAIIIKLQTELSECRSNQCFMNFPQGGLGTTH